MNISNGSYIYLALKNGSRKEVQKLFEELHAYLFIIEKTQAPRNAKFINEVYKNICRNKQPFVTDPMIDYANNIKVRLKRTLRKNGVRL